MSPEQSNPFLCHQNNPIQKHIEKHINMTNKPNDNIAYVLHCFNSSK